jgi:hypothetical protein
MKAFLSILILIIIVGVLVAITRGSHMTAPVTGATPATGGLNVRLKECPDEMIVNNMPGPGEHPTSYYVVKGTRHEISEFDDAWVAQNCQVPTQAVY